MRFFNFRYGVPTFAAVVFFLAMGWARSRDPFERIEFSLETMSGGIIRGIAVLPRLAAKYPGVVYPGKSHIYDTAAMFGLNRSPSLQDYPLVPILIKHLPKIRLPGKVQFGRIDLLALPLVRPTSAQILTEVLKVGFLVGIFFPCLFTSGFTPDPASLVGSTLREVSILFGHPETQWMIAVCMGVYLTAFGLLHHRFNAQRLRNVGNSNYWLAGLLFFSLLNYCFHYATASQTTHFLTLLGGAVLGQGVAIMTGQPQITRRSVVSSRLVMAVLLLILLIAAVWRPETGFSFQYRGHDRWSGPWDNPNIYGLLMAVGVVLAFGFAISHFPFSFFDLVKVEGGNISKRRSVVLIFCLAAAGLLSRGLLHSYCRGAWVAALCGLVYLAVKVFNIPPSVLIRWTCRKGLTIAVIVLGVCVLAFWQFRQTEWNPARRVFSAANVNDLSWRNRIVAWEGTLQMMADRPMLGFGWNQTGPAYNCLYRPFRMAEAGAIETNDYLMLGATVGLPALFCFIACIHLFLTRTSDNRNQAVVGKSVAGCLRTTACAGALVLAIGFWFDGGLFKLATASTFWILLGLCRRRQE